MGVLTRFKLDGGTNQAAARRLLPPEGLIRRAVNFRLRRDSELEQRPGFTALDMTRQGGSLSAEIHDLHVHNGRLFGIGNTSQHATDNMSVLWEYVGAVGGWRVVTTGPSMPYVIDVRDIAATAEIADGVWSATCAAAGGLVLMAYDTTDSLGFARVVRAVDDVTIVSTSQLGNGMVRPVCMLATSGLFHIVGVNSVGTLLRARSFNPATDETIGNANSLLTVDTVIFAAATVLGSPGGYVVVGRLAGDLVVRHYSDSHVQQMTVTIAGIAPTYLSISANGPQNRITIAYVAAGVVSAVTVRLDTGGNIVGPGAVFNPATTTSWCTVKYNSDTTVNAYTIAAHMTSASPEATWIITGDDTGFGGGGTFGSRLSAGVLTAEMATVNPLGSAGASPNFFGFRSGDTDQIVTGLGDAVEGGHFFKDFGTATGPRGVIRLGSHVQDASTGLFYMTTFTVDAEGIRRSTVTEYRANGIRRRQSASIGGALYFSGGLPSLTDGLQLAEQAWGEAPVFISITSSNAGGSVTASAAYFVQCHAEWVDARGDVHKGPVSRVQSITTGGGHNRITGAVAGVHSLRVAPSSGEPMTFRLVFHRTAALADKSAGENLYRETSVSIPMTAVIGDSVAFTLTASDDALRAIGTVIYTQTQSPISNQAPPPYRYCWPIGERLAAAGLPRRDQWLVSKLTFPGEPVNFADTDFIQFTGRAEEDIHGISGLGGNVAVFCRRSVHLWQGEGPDHSGQGSFSYAGCLSREGGLIEDGFRSLVETDAGVFFQRDDEQICLLTPAGVQWAGQSIRDELATYPVVVAATFLRKQHSVAFALQNAAGDAGEVVSYDLRRKVWFVHDLGVVDALCEYQGRMVYCTRAGAVFQQDAAPGVGTMPTQVLETHDFDFGTGQSWGEFITTGAVGEYQGDTTLELFVTYDSGVSYGSAIASWPITAANGYSAGKPFSVEKAIPERRCARFGLKWQLSGSSGSAGLRINEITLETEAAPGFERRPARDTQ